MAQGVELATGYVSLTVSARGIAQDIQREIGGPVDRASREAGKSIEDNIGGGASRAAQTARLAISSIGSAAILSGLSRATEAASNLEQAVGGTASVFQEAAVQVDEFAEGAADSIGLSERATRELTSQLGASLKGYGFAVDEAADKSIELTNLGADLAATFGGTAADAVQALSSALRGEFDPLERYGIALRQSAIDAKAVELGLADASGGVDAMARAQAALATIFEQSADAQGAVTREYDTAAAAAQRASAQTEDAAASLGDAILPLYAKTADVVADVAGFFSELPDAVQTGVIALAGVTAVAGPISNLVGLYRSLRPATQAASQAVAAASSAVENSASSFDDLYDSGNKSSGALRGMSAAGGALAAVGIAATLYEIGQAANEVTVDLEGAAGATTDELVEAFDILEGFSGQGAVEDAFRQLAEGGEASAQAAVDLRDAYAAAGADVSGFDAILTDVADSQAIAADRANDGTDAVEAFTSATGPAADAQEALGVETRTTARELFDWTGALDDGLRSLRDFYDLQTASSDVAAEFRDTLRDFTSVQEQSNEGTLTGQERLDAFRDVLSRGRDDILDMTEALFQQGQTTDEVIPQVQAMADELFDAADAAGLTADQTNFLRSELGLMPEQIDLNVRSNVDTVLADFQELKDEALAFGFQDLQANIPSLRPGSNFQARADGGDFGPGWLLTGEEGPELTYIGPGMGGTVVSAPDTAALFASGGTSQVNTWNIYNPIAEPASESMRKLRRAALEYA